MGADTEIADQAPPGRCRRRRPRHDQSRRDAVSVSSGKRDHETGAAPPHVRTLLAAVDGIVRDAQVRERFGELGPAFSTAFGSLIEPFAVAMGELKPTSHSQAAARAVTDMARLMGAFAGDCVQRLAGDVAPGAGSTPGERYTAIAARVDRSFREFSSSAGFDNVRRSSASAILDWLEQDRVSASAIARALEPPPAIVPPGGGDSAPGEAAAVPLDANATLVRFPTGDAASACVLVVPGFAVGTQVFDLDPQHCVARTLARHGVETWFLDWGRADETERMLTVANRLDRIDRAVEHVRAATGVRHPALAGHFHGGLLALLYCVRHPGKAGALVTISTPVEFGSRHDAFADWLRACDGDRLVDVFGNIPGAVIAALLAAASPLEWCGGGFFTLLDGVDSPDAVARVARIEHARRFPPAFPGETFRGLYRSFYRDNAFATGGVAVLDGSRFDLSSLGTPLLNVFARDDRIVPPHASAPFADLAVAADCTNRELSGGHYDLLAGHRSHTRFLPDIAAWLMERAAR